MELSTVLKKMSTSLTRGGDVDYRLEGDGQSIRLNDLLGKFLILEFTGEITCLACGRKIQKSYQQGYCYPCARSRPQADICQVRPELCHFDKGSCRDESWGKENCFIHHTVYLSLSSAVKVGITRTRHRLNRWMDQGAVEAVAVCGTASRIDAGRVELELKKIFADKTNWRAMLKNEIKVADLSKERLKALGSLPDSVEILPEPLTRSVFFRYPVLQYPEKIISLNPEKTPKITGNLLGIKAQYLIFDSGVFHVRKHSGRECRLSVF